MSRPTTFRDVFEKALETIESVADQGPNPGTNGRIGELRALWDSVEERHVLDHIREATQVEEYYPGRYSLTIGGDHQGEARVFEREDKPYRVELLKPEPRILWAASLAEVKGNDRQANYREKELA